MGPHGDLLRGFFTGDIERHLTLCQFAEGLQQQGAFPRARLAAHQNAGSGHQPTTQHQIQLLTTRADTGNIGQIDFRQRVHHTVGSPGKATATAATRGGNGAETHFSQRIPCTAVGALPLPFGVIRTTVVANIGGGFLSGQVTISRKCFSVYHAITPDQGVWLWGYQ